MRGGRPPTGSVGSGRSVLPSSAALWRRIDDQQWRDEHAGHRLCAPPGHLDELRRRLAELADRRGVLDVAYRTVDPPVGERLIAATSSGVVRVAFPNEQRDDLLQQLTDKISPRVLHAPQRLDRVATELDEYFAGSRQSFDLPLDWRLASQFRRTMLDHLRSGVGFGQTASYGTIARRIGHPSAARAVGPACATNPLPVIVPCHRVIRGDGVVGDYIGGAAVKRMLLDLETTGRYADGGGTTG